MICKIKVDISSRVLNLTVSDFSHFGGTVISYEHSQHFKAEFGDCQFIKSAVGDWWLVDCRGTQIMINSTGTYHDL